MTAGIGSSNLELDKLRWMDIFYIAMKKAFYEISLSGYYSQESCLQRVVDFLSFRFQ